jgi:DUF971 family protein
VRGHRPSERRIESGKATVLIRDIQPIGNYAVRLVFDDGHATGLYTWSFLRELGLERDQRWTAYLQALKARGLTREGAS